MISCRKTVFAAAPLVVWLAVMVTPDVDYGAFKTDTESDAWLRDNSVTYAKLVQEINGTNNVRGYRFTGKDEVRRGMVAWVDGYLEIQLNPALSGPDRLTTLIFEVANAARSREHQQIDFAADEGLIRTQEEFGLAHEMIEYEALRLHRQVLIEIESRGGPLPAEFFYFVAPAPSSIKDYQLPDLCAYLRSQQESGHTAHYYKYFHLRVQSRNPQ